MNTNIDPFKWPLIKEYYDLLNSWDIQAWIYKDVETILTVNNKHIAFLGKDISDLENKKICDIIGHKSASACYESNLQVLKNRKSKIVKQWVKNSLGEKRLLLILKAPLDNGMESEPYILCTAVDITDNLDTSIIPEVTNKEYINIVENMEQLIIRFLPDTTITFVNKSSNNYFKKNNKELIGKKYTDLFPSQYHSQVKKRIKSLTKDSPVITYEIEILTENKQVIWQKWTQQALFDENGKIKEYQSVGIDITNIKINEQELKNNFNKMEQKYYSLIESSPVSFMVIKDDKIIFYNNSTAELLGAQNTDLLLGRNIYEFVDYDCEKSIKKYLMNISKHKHTDSIEGIFANVSGEKIYVQCSGVYYPYEDEEAILLVLQDITKRKKAQDTIKYMAYHDSLTSLPNKYYLRRKIKTRINNGEDNFIALIFIDLDRFKTINDTLGHAFGDIVLKIISERLDSCIRENDIVTRYGGDEFIVLISRYSKFFIEKAARDIIDVFSTPIIVNKHRIYITASLGISIHPEHGNNQDTLIKCANLAVNIAKDAGGNNYKIFDKTFKEKITHRMEMENKLREGIQTDNLIINYQPQIDLINNSIIGFEALVRLKDENSNIIMPVEFINIAEETGLIIPLGECVLMTACKKFKKWKEKYSYLKHISVNVSVRQFQFSDFVKTVKQILLNTGLEPKYLKLEITESIIQNIELSQKILAQLKELGVKIALDDFGTGYSSLSIIQNLPIDTLKIDKSFISCMKQKNSTEAIVKSIIDMGKNLNMDVIAEGIEEKYDLEFLTSNKCLTGQGYYFSKAVPDNVIEKLLNKNLETN